jgi:hypothetical protein
MEANCMEHLTCMLSWLIYIQTDKWYVTNDTCISKERALLGLEIWVETPKPSPHPFHP